MSVVYIMVDYEKISEDVACKEVWENSFFIESKTSVSIILLQC